MDLAKPCLETEQRPFARGKQGIREGKLGVKDAVLGHWLKSLRCIPYIRSAEVRKAALFRAKGKCEFCEALGFQTAKGRLYLETHHVIPLSEDGPDLASNVVALCPNHHRESHHGQSAEVMKAKFLAFLRG